MLKKEVENFLLLIFQFIEFIVLTLSEGHIMSENVQIRWPDQYSVR